MVDTKDSTKDSTMDKIMFDSNVFDRLSSFIDLVKRSTMDYQYIITSIQIEELCRIPDERIDKRIENMLMLVDIRASLVPISVFIPGKSRCGYARLGYGHTYSKILGINGHNADDAIIADTAVYENCTLITDDKKLYGKMKMNNLSVMYIDEFMSELKAKYP